MLTNPQFIEFEIHCIIRLVNDWKMCKPNKEKGVLLISGLHRAFLQLITFIIRLMHSII